MSRKIKHLCQVIAIFMVLILLPQCLPLRTLAQSSVADTASTAVSDQNAADTAGAPAASEDASSPEPTVLGEDISRREEYVKHFLLSDHTYQAVVYSTPVHYQKDGAWLEIDNTLSYEPAADSEDENGYTNAAGSFKVKFANNSNSSKLLRLRKDKYELSWGYVGGENTCKATAQATGSAVTYAGVEPNADLVYQVTGSGIKENIVVNAPGTAYTYTFELKTKHLTLRQNDDGSIAALDADTEEPVFTIPAPYMYDANDRISQQVSYTLTQNKNGKATLTVTADANWINNEETAFPVTVDPPIIARLENKQDPGSGVRSTSILSGSEYHNKNLSTSQYLYVGWETSKYGRTRTLLDITLPQLSKGDMVVGASLALATKMPSGYTANTFFYSPNTPDQQIDLCAINEPWSYTAVTWDTRPLDYSHIYDYNFIRRSEVGEASLKEFDITRLIKEWYESPETNNGLMIKQHVEGELGTENQNAAYLLFHPYTSTNRPYVTINYRSNRGLEDYWTYTSLAAGSAGTASVNDYSGNLVFTAPILTSPGLRMPVSLSAVYNGYTADKTHLAARGWRLSIQHTVRTTASLGIEGLDTAQFPYVYTDGDGTDHYFCQITENGVTTLRDEDGLGLTLTVDDTASAKYTISDDKDNKLYFNQQGNLFQAADANGNSLAVAYDTEGTKILSVQDGSLHEYAFAYTSVGSTEYLSTITDESGRVYTLFHNTSGCLTGIRYPDGTQSAFTYDSGSPYLLRTATDHDDYRLTFVYTGANTGYRVSKITEYGAGNAAGQIITFDRKQYNTTVIRTAGSDGIHKESEDADEHPGCDQDDVVTTLQFDNWGRTTSTEASYGSGGSIGASSAAYTADTAPLKQRNRVSTAASLNRNTANLLTNGSGESTGGWSLAQSAATGTFSYSPEQAYYGHNSLKLTNTAVTASGGNQNVWQDVTGLTAGGTYTFSAYVKVTDYSKLYTDTYSGAYVSIVALRSATSLSQSSAVLSAVTSTAMDNGWRRLSATITLPTDCTAARVCLNLRNGTGTAYFDGMQLESGDVPHTVNLLTNSSFETVSDNMPTGWTATNIDYSSINVDENGTITVKVLEGSCATQKHGARSMRIAGEATEEKGFSQTVPVAPNPNDTYIVSGWADGAAVSNAFHADAAFEIAVSVTYQKSNGSTFSENKAPAVFNTAITGWQFASQAFSLRSTEDPAAIPVSVTVTLRYNKQTNPADFDHIQLVKDVAQTYVYDENGNVTNVAANAEQQSSMGYTNTDLTSVTDTAGYNFTYQYDQYHNVVSALSARNVLTSFARNAQGQITTATVTNSAGNSAIQTETHYSISRSEYNGITYVTDTRAGAFVTAEMDQHGNATLYNYDHETGRLLSVTDRSGTVTNYTYSGNDDRPTAVSTGGTAVNYSYSKNGTVTNRLTGLTFGNDTYTFNVDAFGNPVSTLVNGKKLSTNTYKAYNGLLAGVEYENGYSKLYSYNRLGLVNEVKAGVTGSETSRYTWQYDSVGTLREHVDKINALRYNYTYDSIGRLIRETQYDLNSTDNLVGAAEYGYDLRNNLTRLALTAGNRTWTQNYSYSAVDGVSATTSYAKDNLPTRYAISSTRYADYSHDSLNRLNKRVFSTDRPLVNNYLYALSDRGTDDTVTYRTTQLRTEIIDDTAYRYSYDKMGNVVKIEKGSRTGDTAAGSYTAYHDYEYGALNQLSWESYTNVAGKSGTVSYTYDAAGNITSQDQIEGAVRTNREYLYGADPDAGWSKLLTGIRTTTNNNADGSSTTTTQTIDYDAIGNPVKYLGANLTWEGRELKSYSKSGTSVNYTYDAGGLRASKTVNGVKSTYMYVGDQLAYEKRGDTELYFWYDSYGHLAAFRAYFADGTNALYYALTNAQGDVLGLYNGNGDLRVSYEYDTWGNCTVVDTEAAYQELANLNPIRYRGYYYDVETGLYYVSSRYYDPEIGRWINADSQLNTSLGILGLNQFSYCLNNPVNMVDYGGNKPGDLFDTMDEAARDFAEYINAKSIEDNREYASYIYTKTVTETRTTTYINPNIFGNNPLSWLWNVIFGGGLTKTVTTKVKVTKYTYREPKRGTVDSSSPPINWFGIHTVVGRLHTHAAYDPAYANDIFSSTDKRNAERQGVPTYVATPLGTLRKYDPSNGTDIVLFNDIPFDPNHPGR